MLRKKIIEAAIFQSVIKWINRLITIITAVFLARILSPQDFGLIAIAMAIMSILEGITSLGLNAGLIQNDAKGERKTSGTTFPRKSTFYYSS